MVLRRRDEAVQGGSGSDTPDADGLANAYPAIWEMLSSLKYPDGSSRVPSTLLLFVDAGLVKACLNDRDQGLTAWVSSGGLGGAFAALEKGLANDSLEWRRPTGATKRKR